MKNRQVRIGAILAVLLLGVGALVYFQWNARVQSKTVLPTGCDFSSISPQARWVVYVCQDDLWLAPFPSLRGATRIAQDDPSAMWDRQTVWAPDETGMLIESSPVGRDINPSTVWLVKIDNPQTKTKLFAYPRKGDAVWWAPNRSALVTLSMGGEVRLVRPDSSDKALPIHGLIMRTPAIAWSPDSQHIAYMEYGPPTNTKSYVIDLNTLQSTLVYTDVGIPEWFPDGKAIALIQWNRIDAVRVDGSGLMGGIDVPKGFTTAGSVAWHPDDSRLAVYLRNHGPDYKPVAIGIVDWKKMTISTFEVDPAIRDILTWLPDGEAIIVLAHEENGDEALVKIPIAR